MIKYLARMKLGFIIILLISAAMYIAAELSNNTDARFHSIILFLLMWNIIHEIEHYVEKKSQEDKTTGGRENKI